MSKYFIVGDSSLFDFSLSPPGCGHNSLLPAINNKQKSVFATQLNVEHLFPISYLVRFSSDTFERFRNFTVLTIANYRSLSWFQLGRLIKL